MQSFFNREQINKLTSIALEAGKVALKYFESKDLSVQKKSDGSQVTSADIAVSQLLHEKLSVEFPEIPIICEEGDLRLVSGGVFFLTDPIDGTSSFISGKDQFAINIALVKEKKVVFGLIYAPIFENGRMVFSNQASQVVLWSNLLSQKSETILKISENSPNDHLNIVVGPRVKDDDINNHVDQLYPAYVENFSICRVASAVKFFYLLEGRSNLYLHPRPSMEWDIASGQVLVELMGGKVKKIFSNQEQITIGEDLDYLKPNFLNQSFIATIRNL